MARKPARKSSCVSPEAAAEDLIYRVFSVELRDVLDRFAAAIDEFRTIVHESFQPHPHNCYVSAFWNERAARANRRITALQGDSRSLLAVTIDSFGRRLPVLSEPFTCQRVSDPSSTPGEPVPRREPCHVAATIGWMTPNERRLHDLLGARLPVGLEIREAVEARRTGLCAAIDADGVEKLWNDPSLAEADVSIANDYPILVKPDMTHYAMAVSNATLDGLESLAESVRRWKPRRESARTLDPDWPQLVHTYTKVIHEERRFPNTLAPAGNGDAKPPAAAIADAIAEQDVALLAFLAQNPSLRRKVSDVLPKSGPGDRKAIAKRLRKLAERTPPLVEYPKGQHGKVAILPAGIEMWKRATTPAPQ